MDVGMFHVVFVLPFPYFGFCTSGPQVSKLRRLARSQCLLNLYYPSIYQGMRQRKVLGGGSSSPSTTIKLPLQTVKAPFQPWCFLWCSLERKTSCRNIFEQHGLVAGLGCSKMRPGPFFFFLALTAWTHQLSCVHAHYGAGGSHLWPLNWLIFFSKWTMKTVTWKVHNTACPVHK